MSEVYYDLSDPKHGMNYRWVQPPQVAYFVTTMDKHGNPNAAPVTLGTCVSADMVAEETGNYYFTFSLGYTDLPLAEARQSSKNLAEVPECVISYIGAHLFKEAQVASLPLPRGINEIDVMGLTPLPSKKVSPPGIKECKVNLEAWIEWSMNVGKFYRLFLAQIVGVSVDEEMVEADSESYHHGGIYGLDPLFEYTALGGNEGPARIHTIRLDPSTAKGLSGDIGPRRSFVGTFENWLEDEVNRGALTDEDRTRIIELNEQWQANRDAKTNGAVKEELTQRLRALIPPEA